MELDILGRRLHVQGATPELWGWLEERWHFPQYQGLLQSNHQIKLECLAQTPEIPQVEPWTLQTMNAHFEVRQLGEQVWLGSGAWGVCYDTQNQRIRLWGKFEGAAQGALFVALFEVLATTGLVYLHTAAAAQNGKASLFLGPSGRGKTSTLRRAIQAGWTPIAEDVVWLEPQTLQVFGWDKGVRVLPHDLAAWQQFKPGLKPGELIQGKHFFSYAELGLKTEPGPLEQIILLERDANQPTAWLPASPSQTVMGLWQATGVPVSAGVRSFFQTALPDIVYRLQLRRLRLGQGEPFA